MTTKVKIENVDHGVPYNVIVNECDEHMGDRVTKVATHTLAPGQSIELYVYGTHFLYVGEESVP